MAILVDENGNILTKNGRILTLDNSQQSGSNLGGNLGTLSSFDELNSVQDFGYYQFKIDNNIYFMEVEKNTDYVLQSILIIEERKLIERKLAVASGSEWITTEEKIITSNDITDQVTPMGGEDTLIGKVLDARVGVRLNNRINQIVTSNNNLSIINLGNVASVEYVTERNAGVYTFQVSGSLHKTYIMFVENYLGADYAVMQTIFSTNYDGSQSADNSIVEIITREWMRASNSWLTRTHKMLTTYDIQDTLSNQNPYFALSARMGNQLDTRLQLVEEKLSQEGIDAASSGTFKNLGAVSSFGELEDVKTLGYYVVKFNDSEKSYFCIMTVNYNTKGLLEQIIVRYSEDGEFELLTRTFDEENDLWSVLKLNNYLTENDIIDDLKQAEGVTDKPLSANAGQLLDKKIDNVEAKLIEQIEENNPNITIIDNLTSELANAVLSARQGKILNDKIKNISGAFKYIEPKNEAELENITESGLYSYVFKTGHEIMSVRNDGNKIYWQRICLQPNNTSDVRFKIQTKIYDIINNVWWPNSLTWKIDEYPQPKVKTYRHDIVLLTSETQAINFSIINNSSTPITNESELIKYMPNVADTLEKSARLVATGRVNYEVDSHVGEWPVENIHYDSTNGVFKIGFTYFEYDTSWLQGRVIPHYSEISCSVLTIYDNPKEM